MLEMQLNQLNVLDVIVLSVVGLSTLLAFFRGFVKEVLSLGAWIGAAFITLYAYPYVAEWLGERMESQTAASGAATIGTFVVALITISLFNSLIFRFVKEGKDVGMLDNFLGLIFGAVRGAFVVSLAFLIFSLLFDKDHYPEGVKQAQTLPYLQQGSAYLSTIMPDYLNKLPEAEQEETKEKLDNTKLLKPQI